MFNFFSQIDICTMYRVGTGPVDVMLALYCSLNIFIISERFHVVPYVKSKSNQL